MRICDIAQFYSPLSGGVKRYLADKRAQLLRRPDAQHVLVIPSHRDAVTREGRAVTCEIASPRLPGSQSYRLLIGRKRILAAVLREQPQLIEVGDPYRTAWIGLEAARTLGVPILANYHSDFPRALGRTIARVAGEPVRALVQRPVERYLRALYNRMDATVVATARIQRVLAAMGMERVVQVPLGTDVDAFRPHGDRAAVRAELGLAPDQRMLLFVGRMGREKNIRALVGALELLPRGAARLVLVGDGELQEFVRAQAERRADVIWLPYCDSVERLAELYTAADLFVHPGTQETFGLVALEAQACGTPVMVVRNGGVEDAIAGEANPVIAADGSSEALAAGIASFLRGAEPEAARAERRARIVSRFSVAGTFERMFALYAHLIGGGAAADFAERAP